MSHHSKNSQAAGASLDGTVYTAKYSFVTFDPAVFAGRVVALVDMGGPLPRRALQLMTAAEAATFLDLEPTKLANMRARHGQRGGGPGYFKLGSRVFYDQTDLEEWALQRRLGLDWTWRT